METIWFGVKLAVGLVLGLFVLYGLYLFIYSVIEFLRAPQVSEEKPMPREAAVATFEKGLLAHENEIRRFGDDLAAVERERHHFAWHLGLLGDPYGYGGEPAYHQYRHKYGEYERGLRKDIPRHLPPCFFDDHILELRFAVEGKEYTLLLNDTLQPYSSMPDEERSYKQCSIQDEAGKVVFLSKLRYREHSEGDPDWCGPYFECSELEAFIPGTWVKCLLQKMLEFRQEEQRQTAKYQEEEKRLMDERRRKNFLG
jgi:hypothetical protein